MPPTRERFVLFDVERTTVAGHPALAVRGELDVATAPRLSDAVDAQLAAGPQSLVVDLTHTAFLDSSGARELARSGRKASAADVELHVLAPRANRAVRLPIDLLELSSVVSVVESAAAIGLAGRDARP